MEEVPLRYNLDFLCYFYGSDVSKSETKYKIIFLHAVSYSFYLSY